MLVWVWGMGWMDDGTVPLDLTAAANLDALRVAAAAERKPLKICGGVAQVPSQIRGRQGPRGGKGHEHRRR